MLKKVVCLIAVFATVASLLDLPVVADESENYYGRRVLSELPNSEALLYAYDKIVAAVEAHDENPIGVYDGVHPLSKEEFDIVRDVYRRDYAHHFWLSGRWTYTFNNTQNTLATVTLEYLMTTEQTSEAKRKFEAKVDEILAQITPEMSQFDIELLFHDTIAENTVYKDGVNAHNAYGALVEGEAVCEGYAEAFQYLLHRAGIGSFLALGESINVTTGIPEGHEWNYVNIDGKWYQTDVTWDDQGNVFHAYFNLSDGRIATDHTVTPTSYPLPKCDSDDAFYYKVNPGFLEKFEVDAVAKLLKDQGMSAKVYVNDRAEFIKWFSDKENITAIASAAGVVGSFSYSYSGVGNEVMISFKTSGDDVLLGDVDGNGKINARDIIAVMRYMLGNTPEGFNEKAADMDANGKVNARDIIAIMRVMLGSN